MFRCMCTCVCIYNPVAFKVCYRVLVVIFPRPHDRGCEIKIIVIVRPLLEQNVVPCT